MPGICVHTFEGALLQKMRFLLLETSDSCTYKILAQKHETPPVQPPWEQTLGK